MWGDCFSSFPKPKPKPHDTTTRTFLLLKNTAPDDDPRHHHPPTTTIAMIVTSWARGRRLRYLFLALCSPLILPLLCAAFPLICAVEICFRLCQRRRRRRSIRRRTKAADDYDEDDEFESDAMRRCEEGGGGGDVGEMRLLQRYLEDQLILVLESVYECGELGFGDWDDDDDNDDGEIFDSSRRNPLPPNSSD